MSEGQLMIATNFTGKLPGLVVFHGNTPSVNHHHRGAFFHRCGVPGQTRKTFYPAWLCFFYYKAGCPTKPNDQDPILKQND